jgi:hypothetical protein
VHFLCGNDFYLHVGAVVDLFETAG